MYVLMVINKSLFKFAGDVLFLPFFLSRQENNND